MTDPIAMTLGIPEKVEPMLPVGPNGNVQVPETVQDADFNYVRNNLYDITHKSSLAITELVEISKASQDHNLYSALAKLIDVAVKANIQIAKLAQEDPKNKAPIEGDVTNNTVNIYNATNTEPQSSADRMADILKMIAQAKESTSAIIDGEVVEEEKNE